MTSRGNILWFVLLTWSVFTAMAQEPRGAELYQTRCAQCHGPKGWGDEEKRVPALAGLPAAYILRQIAAYKMISIEDVEDVAAFVTARQVPRE
jgi:cytochrome c553